MKRVSLRGGPNELVEGAEAEDESCRIADFLLNQEIRKKLSGAQDPNILS